VIYQLLEQQKVEAMPEALASNCTDDIPVCVTPVAFVTE